MAYRFYIADSLQLSAQNKYIVKSLRDILYGEPDDDRTGDQIAEDIIKRAGLKLGDR
jgi:hypothetical protein